MLKRSPRSKFVSIFAGIAAVIALYFVITSVTQLYVLSHDHGARKTYAVAKREIHAGDQITKDDVSKQQMFSGDAPTSAITFDAIGSQYSQYDMPAGSVILESALAKNYSSTVDSDERIVFIPTKEPLDKNLSNRTDLLAVDSQGFGSTYVARDALILFDVETSNDTQKDSGYFVRVTEDEAENIAQALSEGEIHFALVANNH
jgi:hypothetical protein